jgi:ribosomal-protein-alanine N-acetyltransferase
MRVTLRSYEPQDFETLYKIDQVCYLPDIAYSREDFRTYMRFPGADCVVAEARGRIVGFCLTANKGAQGYIITIDVLEEFRRHGAGSALVSEVERRLMTLGVRRVRLETATDNESAIAFWQKHGYRKRAVRKGYYPGGRDAYAMSKTMEPPAAKSKERP